MNRNTKQAVIALFDALSSAIICRCDPKEISSGHRTDCKHEEIYRLSDALIAALRTDETMI